MTSEARMMRAFQHENVVKLYGLVAETSPVTLVVEFMSGGDLARALRKRKIPPQYRIQLALHAALGIEHIHEKHHIHRDLAARNCLLTKDYRILKIADFGLTRKGHKYILRGREAIAIRWQPPEALQHHIFTPQSDIWSFGVLIYEIFTNGAEPYEGIKDVRKEVIDRRGHVIFPENVIKELPTLIPYITRNAFAYEPDKRLTMKDYRAVLQKMVAAMSGNSAGQSHSRKHRTNRANAANLSNRPSRSTVSPTPQQNRSKGSRHAPGVPQPAVASKRIRQSRRKEPSEAKNSSRRKKKESRDKDNQQNQDSCRKKKKRERDED
ncbi:hypothetical protein WR25_16744 [Diploscapter pachys]|uniref:Protein kinase domain-containing protein n=1 Tax=Diploscapter pachys TaxID=2018661 RepID=A0A2A2J597_9BILA|nr:hypothetical protein WR25_16744 [Diploscapter pachys]